MRIDFRRWGVFNLVGFAGFLVQIGAIAVLTRRAGLSPLVATAIALELAALQNFLAHSRWTWGDRREATVAGWLRRYGRYQGAKTASLAGNFGLTALFLCAGVPAELANTAAVLVCAIPNFLLSEHLVFHGVSNP